MSVARSELEAPPWAEPADADAESEVKHGYPPPRLSVGSVTTAYCGAPMVVEGTVSDQPPRDACPLCALAWQSRRHWPARGWSTRA